MEMKTVRIQILNKLATTLQVYKQCYQIMNKVHTSMKYSMYILFLICHELFRNFWHGVLKLAIINCIRSSSVVKRSTDLVEYIILRLVLSCEIQKHFLTVPMEELR